jgi:RNA polymerase sigma factor (sigma-70 family)
MRGDGGGVDEGFAAWVRERGEHHLRVAVLLTGDWHAAEDLVQASLVKLYRVWQRLVAGADPDAGPGGVDAGPGGVDAGPGGVDAGPGGFGPDSRGIDAYLRRVMVNTQRSWWRARWRREVPAAQLPEGIGGDDIAERQAVGAVVRQALAGLSRQQRAVLVLRYCEDLPEAEVAELLGCSVGTVKTHAHRGMAALRERLGSELSPL